MDARWKDVKKRWRRYMQAATPIDVKHGFANNGSRYGVICKVMCRVICRVMCRVICRVIFSFFWYILLFQQFSGFLEGNIMGNI